MSRKIAALVYSRRAGSMIRKALLAYFAERANDDGTGVWASKQRIADEIEASRRAVIMNIQEMVEEGLLIEIGKRPCSNGHTIEYAMNLSAIANLPEADPTDPCKIAHVDHAHVQGIHVTRASDSRQDVNPVHTNRPLTVLEPSNTSDRVYQAPPCDSEITPPVIQTDQSYRLDQAVQEIWSMTPDTSRKRSSKKELEAAIRGLKGKVSIDDLRTALTACINDPQMIRDRHKYMPGIHRWIRDGRYESFLPKDQDRALLSEERQAPATEHDMLDLWFGIWARGEGWHGRHYGFLFEPDDRDADYPEELYVRHGLKKPERV